MTEAEELLEKLEIIYYGQYGLSDKGKYRKQCIETVESYVEQEKRKAALKAWQMSSVQTLVGHCKDVTPTGNFKKLDFNEWYDEYLKQQ